MPLTAADRGRHPIFAICETQWLAHKSDCSGFVRAVARAAGVPLDGLANHLVDVWRADQSWNKLGHDHLRAAQLAESGYFVVAGRKEDGHGHVVVIVPGRGNHGEAMGYRGRLGGVGFENKGLGFAWKRADLDDVEYFARAVPTLAPRP